MRKPARSRRPGRPRQGGPLLTVGVAGSVLLLGWTADVFAQATGGARPTQRGGIHGVVLDGETREPLPGAAVRLVELGREELTHSDGTFRLPNLPAGEYTLLIQRLGYGRESRRVSVAADEIVRLEIALSVAALELPGLVVTGTPGARLGDQALRPTTVLSGRNLTRKLDGTLGAMLEHGAGIAAVSMGPATARPVIRGLGGDRILILEDGARIGDLSAASADHAVAVEPLSARRVEVVRGPAALLYGSNALGGVVNVIREEVPSTLINGPHGTFTVQGQTVNRGAAAEGSMAGSVGRLGLRGEATGRWAGDTRTPFGVLENTSLGTYSLGAGAGWIMDNGHAGAAYRFYTSSYGVPPDTVTGHPYGVTVEMERHAGRLQGALRPQRGPFSAVTMDGVLTNYYHRELEAPRDEIRGGEPPIVGTEFLLWTGAVDVLARHDRLGPFSDGAVGFRAQWRDYETGGTLDTPPAEEYSAAAFVFQEMDLDPVRLHFGARYDRARVVPGSGRQPPTIGDVRPRSFGAVSGSVGLLYEVARGVGIGVSAARAFRTPDMNELFSEGPHLANYAFEVGNPDLREEAGVGLDAFLRIFRDELQAELAVYRNRIGNYIYPRETGDSVRGLPELRFTNEDATLTGIEGSVEWSATSSVILDATGSYTRGTLTNTGEALPMMPPLRGQIGARYERGGYFVGVAVQGAATQERVGAFEEPTPGYQIVNLSGGYRWTAFGRLHQVILRLDNVADREFREHLSRLRQPQPGRSLQLLYRLAL